MSDSQNKVPFIDVPFIDTITLLGYTEVHKQVKGAAEIIRKRFCELVKKEGHHVRGLHGYEHVEFVTVDPETDELQYEGEEFWSYGGHEFHSLTLPANWLTCWDWESEALGYILALKRRQETEQAREEIKRAEARAAFERKQLEELKAKYPDA